MHSDMSHKLTTQTVLDCANFRISSSSSLALSPLEILVPCSIECTPIWRKSCIVARSLEWAATFTPYCPAVLTIASSSSLLNVAIDARAAPFATPVPSLERTR